MNPPRFSLPRVDLDGRSVLITGGTGSFGHRFVRTLLEHHQPRRLLVYSRDEQKQFEMARALRADEHPCLRFVIGDVRDRDRLRLALRDVDDVVHAAALKHVPTAEANPFECIRTNVLGAQNLAQAAIEAGVQRVLALSSDKAVNPINLYGASKLAADKIFVAANHESGPAATRLSVVRYGNVVGSRGSVVPHYRELAAQGRGPLPITDPRMTRFWITQQECVNLVLSSLAQMRGGEIFVPKIPSLRIADLGRALAPGLEQKVVGIRPGEKLHEALLTEDDARAAVDLGDRYVIEPTWWSRQTYLGENTSRLPEGFRYTSDQDCDAVDVARLAELLEDAG